MILTRPLRALTFAPPVFLGLATALAAPLATPLTAQAYLTTGPHESPEPLSGEEIPPPTPAAVERHQEFALELFREVGRSETGNLLLAPSTARAALAMALLGARGTTATEMARTLHLTGDDAQAQFEALQEQLGFAASAHLQRTSRLFGQQGAPFAAPFLLACDRGHGAQLESVDFATDHEAARRRINAWVGQQTSGRVPELLAPGVIDPLTRLVLCDALDFAADWANAFDADRTQSQPFTIARASETTTASTVTVPMMHAAARELRHAAVDGAQIVELPYAGNELSMLLIVPDAVDGLSAIERELTAGKLATWRARLSDRRVAVAMPRFAMRTALHLDDALQALGMQRAFGAGADFSGMLANESTAIGPVVHGAMVRVDETGTEAAGATAVVLKRSGGRPHVVRADRPFLFVIQHHAARDAALFIGRVTDPTATAD